MSTLMVCSKSTKKYTKLYNYDELLIVKEPPNKETLKKKDLYHNVVAIGGGSVIDTAKILSMNSVIAIPTTYSGASETSHAVYWDNGMKYDIECIKPISVLRKEFINLPKHIEVATKIDCISHIIESLISKNSTIDSDKYALIAINFIKEDKWLEASIYAGKAIDITGTNIIHAMSYSLTGVYELPHGVSLLKIFELAKHYKKLEELL